MDPLDELETHFAQIVDALPDEFDSHDFIIELAHEYQKVYVRALGQYPDSDQPFQTVHGQIAKRLEKHKELVTKQGKFPSPNIFRRETPAENWVKTNRG